jgi:hypothetical protein
MAIPVTGLVIRNNLASLRRRLEVLSQSIMQLSLTDSPDSSYEATEFKKKQLESMLLGNNTDIKSFRGGELASSFLRMSNSGEHSHLGIMNIKTIGCNYEKLTQESEISVLDVHNEKSAFCNSCLKSYNNNPDFTKGSINPFLCWRRGHSSSKFGFLSTYELVLSRGNTLLTHRGTQTTKEIQSLLYGVDSNKSQFEIGRIELGSTMLVMIQINSNRNNESSKLSEVKGILNQQLLVSTNLSNTISSSESKKQRDHKDKIPGYIEKTLDSINDKWHLDGPSKNSKGIIGIALINNQNKYAEGSLFQNVLQSFSARNQVWYEMYELENVNHIIKQNLNLSNLTIPPNSSAICILLDPIVDLSGGGLVG